MLPVRVHAPAVRVAALVRLAVPRCDAGTQAAVLAEGDDDRAVRRRTAAVPSVDPSSDEHVGVRQPPCSSSRTAGRLDSSFQAGMNTTVSVPGIAGG